MSPPEADPNRAEKDGQDSKPVDPSTNLDSQMFLAQRQDKEKFPIQFTVDDFMFVEQLTQSKNSVIWLVNYRFANDLLVLKEINFKRFMKHHWVNLQREFLSVQLIHKSVLRTHGYFFVPNKVYFVQEYAKGGDLYQSLKRQGPFSEERVRKILVQLLDAVEYIHSKNIIHRDLKLDNILFTSTNNDQIKVADFGVCFPKTDARADPETKVGTLDYMAPEVLKDSQHDSSYDEKVDVWAIGIITYELMHGFPPFSNPNFERTCFNITQSSFEVSPKLSVQATDFINCVLRKAPHERLTIEGMQNHPWIAASKPAVPRPLGPAAQKAAARAQAAADKAKAEDDDKTMVAKMRAEFLTHHVRCEILRRNTKTVLVMTDCPITRQLLSTLLWLKKYKVVMRSSSDAAKIHEQVLEVQAEVYVVDVSPFNIQAMRSAFRSVLNMPVRPILLALVTITQQRQPHVLADMFDYCIHKPVDRNQMEVFPTAICNNFPENDGIISRNASADKPKPETKPAAEPAAAKKAEEVNPPTPTAASVTQALKVVQLEDAKEPAASKPSASQKPTSLPSVHTGKPAPAKGSEGTELVGRSGSQSSSRIDFVDKDIGDSPQAPKNDREGKTIWQKLKSVSSSLL